MVYFLSLGSNLGEREQTLRRAMQMIGQQIGPVLRSSSLYYSEPWGFTSPHPFCNLCCAVETPLSPLEVLHSTQAIERALGRTRKSNSVSDLTGEVIVPLAGKEAGLTAQRSNIYSDRPIDIDLIRVFDDNGQEIFIDTPELTVPHRLWQQRDFVKVPLDEIMNI